VDKEQRSVVIASFLGWTLDASTSSSWCSTQGHRAEFNTPISKVTFAILLTLVMRPSEPFCSGVPPTAGPAAHADVDVLLYSFIEFASGFSPSLTVLLVLRALYGVAMGANGGRRVAHDGIDPAACARFCLRPPPVRYPTGYFLARSCTAAFPDHRLARHVHGRGAAGVARALHPPARAGVASWDRAPPRAAARVDSPVDWRLGIYRWS